MEALLSTRLKNLIPGCLAAALAGGILLLALIPARELPTAEIRQRVEKNCRRLEAILAADVDKSLRRSERLHDLFASGRLHAEDLEKRESLIAEQNGVITGYVGEIFFYKPLPLAVGAWGLVKKNQDVYFLRRTGPQTYYIRHFMDIGANRLLDAAAYRYPVLDLKFANVPLVVGRSEFSFDQARRRFLYTRVLNPSRGQLILTLVFSQDTFAQDSRRVRRLLIYGLAWLLFFILFLLCGREGALPLACRLLALAGMAFAIYWGIAWLGTKNLYFSGAPAAARSVLQLLALLIALLIALRLLLARIRLKNDLLSLAVFDGTALAAFFSVERVLRGSDFPFGDFALNPDYLGLLVLLIGLHVAPLLAAAAFMKNGAWRRSWPLVPLQVALLALGARALPYPPLISCLLTLAFFVLLFRPRRAWLRTIAILFLLAFALSLWLSQHTRREKMAFISENLKPIFSSQNHYAKLVAREIVYELNSRNTPFYTFFGSGEGDELAEGWQNTLAAREGIASGIYAVSGEGDVRQAFSYQLPYMPLKKENIFPFWHVENVEASLFGRRVRLAVATINVFQEQRYLGYIMVQVLNTAELILKSREQQSILTVDRKIHDAGIGYIKLDENRRILENPLNINVQNLETLLKSDHAWVRFHSMGIAYSGYVFDDGDETTIIFFPVDTFIKSFSEYVKILCFLLLFAALFNLRHLGTFQWRSVFGSFSMKVFAILLLLSLITATVFSLFSLNFNATSQETRRSQAAYRRGRSALTIINNILAGAGEISQDHMFLLEKILENDISVYENGTLLFTSDLRKIVRSELPIYLNSGIRDRLRQENQQFELRKSGNALDLFFKTTGGYVFHIEFPFDSAEQLRAQRYFVDFIVTMFFGLILIGLAAAFFFRNKIVAPIHRLNRGMADVQRGDLRPLADIPAESELRELYLGFNSMLEGIQAQKQNASEIARMKTLVQLGRRVAHEVKNPLTPIRLSAEQILRSLQDKGDSGREVIANAVRYIIEETEHLRRVAFGFLNLSKLDELQAEPFRLDDLVAEAVAHLRAIYPQVRFSITAAGAWIDVVADRQKIKQAIDNVLTNALEALGPCGGEIGVTLGREDGLAVVRIRDNGEGIGSDELERIAREEFSSKDLGTGLGLVIARRFLELHNGGLEIESCPGAGTTVVMRFAYHAPQA
jgi:signal transduction histidine kinase